ncbi:ATP-binding protein [Acinetobacter baumannii]|nr:ATP-binding protein [Acinetobacter baumannii]
MPFRIKNFLFANKVIELSKDQTSNSEHTFSLITGINAVGKSRLLTSIIQSYLINSKKYEMFKVDSILIDHPIKMPNKIIAITNSLNDKFPLKNSKSYIYEYFGNKSNGNIIYDRYAFIKKLITRKDVNHHCICHTFYYLGFLPFLEIYFKHTLKKSTLSPLEIQEIYNRNAIFFEKENLNLNIENPSEKELLLLYTLRKIYYKKKSIKQSEFQLVYNIFLGNNYINFNKLSIKCYYNYPARASSLTPEELNILLDNDVLKITDVNLHNYTEEDILKNKINENNLINFNNLSSGQQALLNIFLSLSSCIEDNSLICIDEPEISLHPEWQLELIIKLQELFLTYEGCHFIIATHSPQIVSGLCSESGYIIDLENNITYSKYEYSKKSSDFQLAKIFNTPGHNNEYLIRIALTILSKITGKIVLNKSDVDNLNLLNNSLNELPENDPVSFLIEQINALVK